MRRAYTAHATPVRHGLTGTLTQSSTTLLTSYGICCDVYVCTAGEGMSAEDRAAVDAAMTAVKNKCFEAVVKGVLHVHNTTIDANGKEKPLTESMVKNYINR